MRRFIAATILTALLSGCTSSDSATQEGGAPSASADANAAFERGSALHKENKEQAVVEYSKAIELDPKFEKAIYNRALANAGLARDVEVLADLARLKELNSTSAATLEQLLQFTPVVYCNQGESALAEDKYQFAIDRFTAALLYAKDDPGILELRAPAHDGLGSSENATADRNAAAAARLKGTKSIIADSEASEG